jgi:HPt (histidine-containing phosphotransfer) domain-containing protein
MKVDITNIASILGIPEKHIPLLVNAFLDEATSIFEQLFTAIEQNDFENITLHAHSIKGSAANLRLEEISELAKSIEFAGKANDTTFDYKGSATQLKSLVDSIEL